MLIPPIFVFTFSRLIFDGDCECDGDDEGVVYFVIEVIQIIIQIGLLLLFNFRRSHKATI